MKKIYSILIALLALVGVAQAQVTVTPTDVSGSAEGISFTTAKNTSTNAPTYNATNKDLRIYAKGSITITSTVGNMKSIVFNLSAQGLKRLAPITADKGSIAAQASGDATVTWTGNTSSVTFTVGDKADYGSEGSSKAGQFDFTDFVVTLGEVDPTFVEKPTITPASGTYYSAQTVTITAGEGCTIYYTTDGGDPKASDDLYVGPFTVDKTTTVKAVAAKGDYMSEVAESVITIDLESPWASSAENPMTVAKALELIQTLDAGKTSDIEVYVKGIVTEVTEVNTTYWNATYKIADNAEDANQLIVYRGFSFNGEKFVSTNDLAVNDQVVVIGKLQNYVKNEVSTPEVATGSKIYSINGETEAPHKEYNSLAAVKAAATADKALVQLNLTDMLVSYVNGSSVYLFDGADGLLIYGANEGIKAGDKISGNIKGALLLYNGLTEIQSSEYNVTVSSSDNPVTVQDIPEVTADEFINNLKSYENELVVLRNLVPTVAKWDEKRNLVFEALNSTWERGLGFVTIRDNWQVATNIIFNPETETPYSVTGFVSVYTTTDEEGETTTAIQIYPRTLDDIEGEKIDAVKGVTVEAAPVAKAIYTVAGQRVQNLNKSGLYIVNGKKVVVK